MSNHACVIPKKMPSIEQIDKDVHEIVSRKFPQFTLEFDGEKFWELTHDPGYILTFWCSETDGEQYIEFRHAHQAIMWWIEYEIREELALRYDATVIDEAECVAETPQKERFANYSEYTEHIHSDLGDLFPDWRNIANLRIDAARNTVPEELKSLVGKNIPEEVEPVIELGASCDSKTNSVGLR